MKEERGSDPSPKCAVFTVITYWLHVGGAEQCRLSASILQSPRLPIGPDETCCLQLSPQRSGYNASEAGGDRIMFVDGIPSLHGDYSQ